MARGSRHARKLARTFQLRDWSVGLSGARQCVAQNGVTRAAGSGSRRGQCHGLLTVGWSYSYKELDMRAKPSVALYSTCPPYRGGSGETYLQHVCDVARWSEAGGCEGILVYTDNSLDRKSTRLNSSHSQISYAVFCLKKKKKKKKITARVTLYVQVEET